MLHVSHVQSIVIDGSAGAFGVGGCGEGREVGCVDSVVFSISVCNVVLAVSAVAKDRLLLYNLC